MLEKVWMSKTLFVGRRHDRWIEDKGKVFRGLFSSSGCSSRFSFSSFSSPSPVEKLHRKFTLSLPP
jgi:hypothetical protein